MMGTNIKGGQKNLKKKERAQRKNYNEVEKNKQRKKKKIIKIKKDLK
jgi:hypothetical protein